MPSGFGQHSTLGFFVSNSGAKPGIINSALLDFPGRAGLPLQVATSIVGTASITFGPILVEQGAAKLFDFDLGRVPKDYRDLSSSTPCAVVIDSSNYLGRKVQKVVTIAQCTSVAKMVSGLAGSSIPR